LAPPEATAEGNGSASPAPKPPSIPNTDRGALGAAAGTSATGIGPGGVAVTAYSLSTWAIARYVLVTVLVLGSIYLLWRIQEVLQLLLLAIIFATAIEPLVNWLRRGPFNRSQGILVVYSALFLLVSAIGFFFVPTLLDQLGTFVETLPERLAALRPLVERAALGPCASSCCAASARPSRRSSKRSISPAWAPCPRPS
jgi:hypothetical protein